MSISRTAAFTIGKEANGRPRPTRTTTPPDTVAYVSEIKFKKNINFSSKVKNY
jgi:hypothetical protein